MTTTYTQPGKMGSKSKECDIGKIYTLNELSGMEGI
jgi:hypothetical protein